MREVVGGVGVAVLFVLLARWIKRKDWWTDPAEVIQLHPWQDDDLPPAA